MAPDRVVIVGAGEMGAGIAQKFAMQGFAVDLVDRTQAILERSRERIAANLDTLVEGMLLTGEEAAQALPRIRTGTELGIVADSGFVLEAVHEDLEAKCKLFRQLDAMTPAHALLTTNTSSLSITRIAAATRRPAQVIGCHWVSPPYLIPLVEVVCGDETSQQTVDACVALMKAVGMVPAVCRKDVPGFIINRMQRVILGEMLDLVERGVVSLEDADNVVQFALGARLALFGPFRVNDMAADKRLTLHGFEYMFRETGDPRFKPSALLKEKVEQGALGIRSGKGWYDYPGRSFEQLKQERDLALTKIIRFLRTEGHYPR